MLTECASSIPAILPPHPTPPQKTAAHRRLSDDVPVEEKSRRHVQITELFREIAAEENAARVGHTQLVLVEGVGYVMQLGQ